MEIDRPPTREALNHGRPTTPRPSACVILLRGGGEALEVLLVQRSPQQRVMGGYWVFPGGAVDPVDGEADDAYRAAALRELSEEAGIGGIDGGQLVKFSRWITPELIRTRFDTQFFLAAAPAGARARCDGVECVDLRWLTPQAALQAHRKGELTFAFPTIKQLEQLSSFTSAERLLEHGRGREVHAVLPRIVLSGDVAHVLLPGETGYDDA